MITIFCDITLDFAWVNQLHFKIIHSIISESFESRWRRFKHTKSSQRLFVALNRDFVYAIQHKMLHIVDLHTTDERQWCCLHKCLFVNVVNLVPRLLALFLQWRETRLLFADGAFFVFGTFNCDASLDNFIDFFTGATDFINALDIYEPFFIGLVWMKDLPIFFSQFLYDLATKI